MKLLIFICILILIVCLFIPNYEYYTQYNNLNNKLQKKTYFIIITQQRSGSTFLVHALNENYTVHSEHELLLKKRGLKDSFNKDKLVKYINESITNKKEPKSIGFKLMFDQIDDSIIKTILNDKSIKIIFLKRQNSLKQFISYKYLKKHKISENIRKIKKNGALNKIYIDFNELIEYDNEKTKMYEKYEQLFKNHNYIKVIYEELINNYTDEMNKIFNFIDVKNINLNYNQSKNKQFTEKRKYEDIVINHKSLLDNLIKYEKKEWIDNF